jgi:hypothetical protein
MRVFAERMPEALATERNKKPRRGKLERGQVISMQVAQLAEWNLTVTTVPADLIGSPGASVVALAHRGALSIMERPWPA